MSYHSVLRIQGIVRRSVSVLMLSVIALAGVVTSPASAQPVQVADWRQSIPGGVGVAVDRMSIGDYVVLGLESPSSIDPSYGEVMTLQRYSQNGQPLWTQPVRIPKLTGYAGVKPVRVSVDVDDNIYVFGNDGAVSSSKCNG